MKNKSKTLGNKLYKNLLVNNENIHPNIKIFDPKHQQVIEKAFKQNKPINQRQSKSNRSVLRESNQLNITEEYQTKKQSSFTKDQRSLQLVPRLNINHSLNLTQHYQQKSSANSQGNSKSLILEKRNKLQQQVEKMLTNQRVKEEMMRRQKNSRHPSISAFDKGIKNIKIQAPLNKTEKQATLSKYLAQHSVNKSDTKQPLNVLQDLVYINSLVDQLFNIKNVNSEKGKQTLENQLNSIRNKLQQAFKAKISHRRVEYDEE